MVYVASIIHIVNLHKYTITDVIKAVKTVLLAAISLIGELQIYIIGKPRQQIFRTAVNCCILTLFRMQGEGEAKRSPTSFSPVISTNVGISPKNMLTFTF